MLFDSDEESVGGAIVVLEDLVRSENEVHIGQWSLLAGVPLEDHFAVISNLLKWLLALGVYVDDLMESFAIAVDLVAVAIDLLAPKFVLWVVSLLDDAVFLVQRLIRFSAFRIFEELKGNLCWITHHSASSGDEGGVHSEFHF